jgi:hypothetical protein
MTNLLNLLILPYGRRIKLGTCKVSKKLIPERLESKYKSQNLKTVRKGLSMVVHACNPRSQEADARGSGVCGQPELCREICL